MSKSVTCVKFKLAYKRNNTGNTVDGVYLGTKVCDTVFVREWVQPYTIYNDHYYLAVPGGPNYNSRPLFYFTKPDYSSLPSSTSKQISNVLGQASQNFGVVENSVGYSVDSENCELPSAITAYQYYRDYSSEDSSKGSVSSSYSGYTAHCYYNGSEIGSSLNSEHKQAFASAQSAYKFEGWYVGGTKVTTTATSANIYVSGAWIYVKESYNQDVAAVAKFVARNKITYDANGGSPTPSVVYANDAGEVTLAAAPTKAGYNFAGWSIGGTLYAAGATYSLSSDETATAVWVGSKGVTTSYVLPSSPQEVAGQTLSISVSMTGSASQGASGGTEGKTVTVSAPASGVGVAFQSWDVSGVTVSQSALLNPTIAFTMPDAAVSLAAYYELKTITVSKGVDSHSTCAVAQGDYVQMLDPSTSQAWQGDIHYGDTVLFVAPEPLTGYTFSGWYANGSKIEGAGRSFTREMKADEAIVAKYAITLTFGKSEADETSGYFSVGGTDYATQTSVAKAGCELGSTIEISATATQGYFGGWKVDGASDISDLFQTETIVVEATSLVNTHSYVAQFVTTQPTFTVTCESVNNNGQGDSGGTIGELALSAGDGIAPGDETTTEDDDVVVSSVTPYTITGFRAVTLVATPATGSGALPLFSLVEVTGTSPNETETDMGDVREVRISKSRKFRARWGHKASVQVVVSVDDDLRGIAYVGPSAGVTSMTDEQNNTVTVTAIPSNGYKFVGWYIGVIDDGEWTWDETSALASTDARYSFDLTNTAGYGLQARFDVDAHAIFAWEGSSDNKTMEWRSKVYVLPKPFDPVSARVDATGYPVTLTVGTYSSPSAVPERDHVLSIANQDGRRLARMRPERFMRVAVESAHEVDAIVVGTNMAEVN